MFKEPKELKKWGLETTLPPGPELDALVATKVMGWTLESKQSDGMCWRDSTGRWTEWYQHDDYGGVQGFYPSTDIRAAWEEVVEKLREMGFWISLTRQGSEQKLGSGKYDAGVTGIRLGRMESPGNSGSLIWERIYDNTCYAICLAALKAKEGE